jgi:hypothetical protein
MPGLFVISRKTAVIRYGAEALCSAAIDEIPPRGQTAHCSRSHGFVKVPASHTYLRLLCGRIPPPNQGSPYAMACTVKKKATRRS